MYFKINNRNRFEQEKESYQQIKQIFDKITECLAN